MPRGFNELNKEHIKIEIFKALKEVIQHTRTYSFN